MQAERKRKQEEADAAIEAKNGEQALHGSSLQAAGLGLASAVEEQA